MRQRKKQCLKLASMRIKLIIDNPSATFKKPAAVQRYASDYTALADIVLLKSDLCTNLPNTAQDFRLYYIEGNDK